MKPLTLQRATRIAWQTRWRAVAAVMLPIYFVTSLPPGALAANSGSSYPAPVLTSRNIHANKHKPRVATYAGVALPVQPADHDITYCHAFSEPLVPVGGKTTVGENKTLGAAITSYCQRKKTEDVSALAGFLAQYPDSAWRPSLDLNLAEVYYDNGAFSDALAAWQDAWDRAQNLKDAAGQRVGNLAAAKLAKMKARIGRADELEALFQQIKGRNLSGSAAQLIVQAQAGLWLMKNRPQDAFRCGPSALQEICLATKHRIDHPEIIKHSQSTPHGIALSDVNTLAGQIGLPMQMARRAKGSEFIVPAVIHWKLGHYGALVGKRDGKYEIHDTTFGGDQFLVSAQVLEKEASGYFLVPKGDLPPGWTSVGKSEGSGIFGRGNTGCNDPDAFGPGTPSDPPAGPPGGDCGSPQDIPGDTDLPYDPDAQPAMTQSSVNAMLVSLNLQDNPLRYVPPIGPAINFIVDYNQRDHTQPATFTYSNLGPGWTYNYLSYVKPGSSRAKVYERGGGVEVFYYNSSTSSYYPSQTTQAILSQVSSTTWQRALPDGKIETFGQPDGSGRFFLTQITDPQGNSLTLTYDSEFRLSYLTDALGQVTTLSYGLTSDPYKITRVTDPFGRYAQFDYDANNRLLRITDIIGITSQFAYLSNDFVTSLTTPYGVTHFAYGDSTTDSSLGTTRWMNVTYPDGNTERTEFNQGASGISNTDAAGIPSGMYPGISAINYYMQDRDTYYWDKQAMKDHPGDYTQAKVIHWLHTSDINTCSDIEESHKMVNQNRIWFGYAGQMSSIQASNTMIDLPTQKGRILDDGSTQLFTYQYNAIGKRTQQIDPAGRETDYVYDTNNIDLLTVEQKNGSAYEVQSSYTYNSQHEVLTATDASGETTTNTYYSNGELHTVTNAKGQTTTYAYDSNGYLTSVTGPVSGATASFSYDGYGRVQTVTDSQGYTTTTDYDVMDRPTQVTYPDSTTSQINYFLLDPQFTKDRLGRWTRYFYNTIRQPVSVLDSLGHMTLSNWTLSAGLDSVIDAAGNKTSWKHDGQNRVTEKDYPDGNSERISYENTTSRIKSTTDPMGQVATATYNPDNTVAQVAYTSATVATPTVSYAYETAYPRLHSMTDGTGTTTYAYNAITTTPTLGAGRLSSVTTPLAAISYTYDELGRPLSQTIDGTASSVTYDTLGRVATATNALSTTAFAHSYLGNTGRVAGITAPNGQSTVYTYQDSTTTGEPRLAEIKNLNASAGIISKFDYGYDSVGQITSWTQQSDSSDPQNWAMQYDNEGKLLGVNVTDTTTSALLHQYAYLHDAAGNRTTEQIDGNATGSSYNNLNQLTGQSAGGQMVFSGTLSKPSQVTVGGTAATYGNYYSTNFTGMANVTTGTNSVPIIAHDVNGNTATNTYQVVVPPASASFSYDLNGCLLTDGARTFGWDAKKELVSIIYTTGANAGNHTEFTYNGAGERVKIAELTGTTIGSGTVTSVKQFVYAGGMAEERDASNTVTKRFFAQGEQRMSSGTATNYFYTRDHLGSIREMMASDGTTIAARYSYDPYGRPTQVSGSISCDFGFTGHYYHATSGLYLAPARAYDPNLGRWLSRDPSGEASGLNLYAYCGGNPICNADPTGLDDNPLDDFNPNLTLTPCVDDPPSPPVDPFHPNLDNGDYTNGINPYDQALDPSAIGNAQSLPISPNTDRSDGTSTNPYISHYGGTWDPDQDGANRFFGGSNSDIPTGNHDNPLNQDSLAISPDVAKANGLKVGNPVYVNGQYLGNYDDTPGSDEIHTIDVYDPTNTIQNTNWGGVVKGGGVITIHP